MVEVDPVGNLVDGVLIARNVGVCGARQERPSLLGQPPDLLAGEQEIFVVIHDHGSGSRFDLRPNGCATIGYRARLIRRAASGAGMPFVYQSRSVRFRLPQTSLLASGGSSRATSSRKAENLPSIATLSP